MRLFIVLLWSIVILAKTPLCQSSNPEVFIIKNKNDWKHINDTNKSIFCVAPGDYENLGKILINSSGTKKKKRYLLLYNNNNKHPSKLPKKERAKYLLYFQNASYWVIDRQSFWESSNPFRRNKIVNSHHLEFKRLHFQDSSSALYIYNGSHDITITNSLFQKGKWSLEHKNFYDVAAIGLLCRNNKESVKNIKVLNNKFINYVDAIQAIRYKNAYDRNASIDFQGLNIAHNKFEITPLFYSNCQGKSDPKGECSFSENGIDLKGGSKNPSNPILINSNIFKGYKKADKTFSNLSDPGSAIVLHYDVANVKILHNYIKKSDYAITIGAPLENRFAASNITISSNRFENITYHALNIHGSTKARLDGAYNVLIQDNLFKNISAPLLKLYNSKKITLKENLFINAYGFWIPDYIRYPKYKKYKNENIVITDNLFLFTKMNIPSYVKQKGNKKISPKSYYRNFYE